MPQKRTDPCCRYCKHYGWGVAKRGQRYETRVCLKKPKIYKDDINNIRKHYYVADPCGLCEEYENQ